MDNFCVKINNYTAYKVLFLLYQNYNNEWKKSILCSVIDYEENKPFIVIFDMLVLVSDIFGSQSH